VITVISTVSTLVCVLVSATGKLGINAGSSSMLFEGLYWVGPCIKLLDSVEADRVSLILKTNYVYYSACGVGFLPGIGFIPPSPPQWGHGCGLSFEFIPHIITASSGAGSCCVRGCLGIDPIFGISGNLVRRVAADSSRCWDLWLLGYTGINIPIGYRDTLSGEPKVLPCDVNLFLSAGFTKRFDESQEILSVVMLGLGFNVWLIRFERKTAYQEVQP